MPMFVIMMIILNAAILYSLKFTLKKLYLLEIFSYWMVTCAVVQQVFTIISISLGFIKVTEGVGVFWFLIMNRLLLMPSILIWLLYHFKDANLFRKIALMGMWIIGLSSIQLLSKTFGMITFIKWNFACSMLEWFVIILISFSFIQWFGYLLKKEGIKHDFIPPHKI